MPTIDLDGLTFDLAQSDGELLDLTLTDRAEFLASWPDWFDHEPTDEEIMEFGREHLWEKAVRLSGAGTWSEADRNGVSAYGDLWPRTRAIR